MRARPGGWRPLTVVAVLVAAVWLLVAVGRSPHRTDLAIYFALVVTVIALVVQFVQLILRGSSSDDGVEELDRAADRLAVAVQAQWEAEATRRGLRGADPIQVTWGRPSQPVAGPAAAAVSSRRFDPLPGCQPAEELQVTAGDLAQLHALYGGLGSGRLVIAGPPGSGKTGAAVLLILDALRYRARALAPDRPKIPVPVLVTAQEWDPSRQSVNAWLIGRLQGSYPLFTGPAGEATAAKLLDLGKITVIIDGLDELVGDLRPVALQALDQQATFRVVVLSRTSEAALAASGQGVLRGAAAIELCPVGPHEAARYLERVQVDPPPAAWRDLIARLRAAPDGSLAAVLDNPLALTLVRDVYHGADVEELLRRCDAWPAGAPVGQVAQDITDHLLDRVLPAAYAPRPGQPPPRYDLATARNALTKIAARMNQDHTRDLQWWHIPRWAKRRPRRPVTGPAGPAGRPPRRLGRLRLRKKLNRRDLGRSLRAGIQLGIGIVIALATVAVPVLGMVSGFWGPLGIGIVAGAALGLGFWLVGGFAVTITADADNTSSLSPAASRRANRTYGLVAGLGFALAAGSAVGLVAGVITGLSTGPVHGLIAGLVNGLIATLVAGLLVGLVAGPVFGLRASDSVRASLAAIKIAVRWHTPVRLMRFLDDACSRNVLRTVGPVYQFRHARLQDRLASTAADVTKGQRRR